MEQKLYKRLLKNIIVSVFWVTVLIAAVMYIARGHLPGRFVESYVAGTVFGVVNLICIERIVINVTGGTGLKKTPLVITLIVLTGLTGGMLACVSRGVLNAPALLTGFTVVLGIMLVQGLRVIKS